MDVGHGLARPSGAYRDAHSPSGRRQCRWRGGGVSVFAFVFEGVGVTATLRKIAASASTRPSPEGVRTHCLLLCFPTTQRSPRLLMLDENEDELWYDAVPVENGSDLSSFSFSNAVARIKDAAQFFLAQVLLLGRPLRAGAGASWAFVHDALALDAYTRKLQESVHVSLLHIR